MLKLVRTIVLFLARRFRGRVVLELENLALCHQLSFSADSVNSGLLTYFYAGVDR
jgi:hypothetical protein